MGKNTNKSRVANVDSYEDVIAIIEIISEIIEKENPSGVETPDRISIKNYLHEKFKIIEKSNLDYPMPSAPWLGNQAILYVPLIKNEDREAKEKRMMSYQKFFFPALNASKIQVIHQVHEIFLSGASKEAMIKFQEAIKQRKENKKKGKENENSD